MEKAGVAPPPPKPASAPPGSPQLTPPGPLFPEGEATRPRVLIVGGGVAGLSAAYRLLERGHDVALVEANAFLGGKLGAHQARDEVVGRDDSSHYGWKRCKGCPEKSPRPDCAAPKRAGDWHEHCYHMYLNWYHNFWDLAEAIGARKNFVPQTTINYLDAGHAALPRSVSNVGSPWTVFRNLDTGVGSPFDAFLHFQGMTELAGRPATHDDALEQTSVTAFLESLMTTTAESRSQSYRILAKAFAAPSYVSSARTYKSFLKYGARLPEPGMWLLAGNTEEALFTPWLEALARLAGSFGIDWPETPKAPMPERFRRAKKAWEACARTEEEAARLPAFTLLPLVSLTGIEVAEGGGFLLRLARNAGSPGVAPPAPDAANEQRLTAGAEALEVRHFDGHVILAVPPKQLGALVYRRARPEAERDDMAGEVRIDPEKDPRLAAQDPALADVMRLRTEALISLDLVFRKPFGRKLPRGIVLLADAKYDLSLQDNSQSWTETPCEAEGAVLNVVASDVRALLPYGEQEGGTQLIVELILRELARYLDFDPETDVVHCRTHMQTNVGEELFINEVGSWQYRPKAATAIDRLWIAGDYCQTPIDVVTIEAAAMSGLIAAEGVRRETGLGAPIPIHLPDNYPVSAMAAMAAATRPAAVAMKGFVSLEERVKSGYRTLFPE
jgi:hypothetical protein